MTDWFIPFLQKHAFHAHWFIFLAALLAGCNIPISIDALVIIAAILATHFVPEHTAILFLSIWLGALFSAWIAYFLGKTVGHWRLFRALCPEAKIKKMEQFYKTKGPLAFFIGRFIPFGVRNALFMTSGICQVPFRRFASFDFFASLLWAGVSFTIFYKLGQNFDTLLAKAKTFNLAIFIVFTLALIAVFCYKRRKNRNRSKENT